MGVSPLKNVLGVFAKEPRPGAAKTRLASETSPHFAARVAEALLLDTLQRFASTEAARYLVFAPAGSRASLESFAGGSYQLIDQGGGDLGQRLQRFFTTQFAQGAERVVVIGSDSPTLPAPFVSLAFESLASADVLLGPATDGGYYMLGCARRVPPIFTGIDWGAHTVLGDTIVRLDPRCRLSLLPPWYDVDTLADWQTLCGHVKALRQAGVDPCVPHTEKLCSVLS
jgi:uncharacterized protein